MRFLFSVLASAMLTALVCIDCAAQEVHLRQEAETLLERADSISTPHQFHSYEQTIVFRSFSATGLQQGRFTSVVQGPRSYRDEYELGDYGLLVVVNGNMVADVGDRALAPVEIRRMTRLNHPYTARFDESDIIRSIQDSQVNGRPARCVEFDTVRGQKTSANELCIDKEYGILARVHANDETITNSDFFPYRGSHLPAHIVYEQNDLRMELEQTKTETDGPFDPDLLTPPANAKILGHVCTVYRRPFGRFMPQPRPGQRSANVDVMVHGTVRIDGTVRDASIDVSERADLNAEALQLFSSWRFTPATCDGTPLEIPAEITLHFQNR
ncbi:MAG TPA: TonB family protein [Candidatus Acidoferrum sp.]|nr:TonB family protein [Candidatus Acidoferrum sp.]